MPRKRIKLETNAAELVEEAPDGAHEQKSFAQAVDEVGTGSMLGYRLEQQAALSNFGMEALKSSSLADLLDHAARTAALGMRASLSKILEYRKAENDLFIRAGVGWRSGVVQNMAFAADIESPAGYAFQTGSPVISNHLEDEDQFRTPLLMIEHGVKRAINVLITFGGGRWGVLEVDSSSSGEFEAADLAFLQGLANFIGVALDRQVAEDRLSQALEYQKLLVQEASHRVKNSLAILSGILLMKAKSSNSAKEADALGDASDRVIAVARTHDRLWREAGGHSVDLGTLVTDLCQTLAKQLEHIDIKCSAETIEMSADDAASFALLVTELVTNSAKHAYGPGGGIVYVGLSAEGQSRLLEVRDEGMGLGPDFTIEALGPQSLGMNLIHALSQSLGGTIEIVREGGAIFRVRF
ncbi:sensor histidine kinase [Aquisediminimonas profunda]|uniref:sensor histidine kinase n=1 Tax=Aquisediminimonas profunda TaxID=1550733 RepID=UPI001C63219A|nr:histidine kinase dimerization/phosphoacceptor domain -containing protein [Aquisediminimonas profunda]